MTIECHHVSPRLHVSLSNGRAVTNRSQQRVDCTSFVVRLHAADHYQCLAHQVFLPVLLQAQQHALTVIQFQMPLHSFPISPPLFGYLISLYQFMGEVVGKARGVNRKEEIGKVKS